jgi:hypothetical protein
VAAGLCLTGGLLGWGAPTAAQAVPAGGTSTLAVTAAGAASSPLKVIRVCVKKRTGAMRLVKKGAKCRKGERRMTWSSTGPAGPAGPAGPRGYTPIVRDGTGAVVPDVVWVGSYGLERLVGTAVYMFWLNGQVVWEGVEDGYLRFLSADCSGPLQVPSYSDQIPDGYERVVVRGADGVTKTAYAYTSSITTVAAGTAYSRYQLVGGAITCVAAVTGGEEKWRALVSVGAPPPDLPGPLLTISFT